MRSSLFKPVIMPGRSAMWRGDLEPGIKKIENKRIGAGSSKHRGSAIRKGQGGLVLTCNPDPGLPLIPLWSHYGVVRVSLVSVPGPEHSIRHSRDDGRLDQRERARVRDNTMTCILSQATLATPGLASNWSRYGSKINWMKDTNIIWCPHYKSYRDVATFCQLRAARLDQDVFSSIIGQQQNRNRW